MSQTPYYYYDPFGKRPPSQGGLGVARILLTVVALLAIGLVAIISMLRLGLLGAEGGDGRRVTDMVYPAGFVGQLEQPGGGEWLLPFDALRIGSDTFVLDSGNGRILKLGADGTIAAILDRSSDPNLDLKRPMAMATDGQRLYVANSPASQVLVVSPSGRVEKVLGLEPSSAGEEPPRPIGIAVTPAGTVLVSDAENHRVLELDSSGRLVHAFGTGTRVGGGGGFNVPGALAVDALGNIYVVDILNARVVELSADGVFIRQFGARGEAAGSFLRPKGVAVDGDGRVFVSDGMLAAVQVFAPDGSYLGFIGRREPADPESPSVFKAPGGLWLEGDTLLIMDRFAGLTTYALP